MAIRKGFGFAPLIKDLDFSRLHNSQMWVLADWIGCRNQLGRLKSAGEQRTFLREECLRNLERAQQGYEVIVLQKIAAVAGAVPEEMEKRMYHVLTDIIGQHKETLSDVASAAVGAAAKEVMGELKRAAHQAVQEAAAKTAPLVIKEKGKKDIVIKGVLPPEFKRIVQLGKARMNIMLVGPTQCGKTYMSEKLAEALGLDFKGDQSCSAGISESVFIGWLLPGKGGAFEHVGTPFLDAYENGGVYVLEEMDAADANLLVFLNKALGNAGFFLPQRKNKPFVKKHKDFVVVACCNTYGHGADSSFVGRNQLDASTLERFRVGTVPCDYSREVVESLAKPDLLEWSWSVRNAIRQKSIKRFMSTGTIKNLAIMVDSADWVQADWEQAYFADWTAEERSLLKQAMVAQGVVA